LKNDIKTKSTDFLPPKPGADQNSQPPADMNSTSTADSTASSSQKPVNPTMPTSAHVIDLKNQAQPDTTQESADSAVKNNPFLEKPNTDADSKDAAKPTSVPVAANSVKDETEMPQPPKAETTPETLAKTTPTGTDTSKPPALDLAHPDSDAKDPLKEAMVSDNSQAGRKPKKKLPTWLLVVIILVVIVVIAIGTFAILNVVARPTGI